MSYNVKFKHPDESFIYPKLIAAINTLCVAKGKNCLCTSGYRSPEKQKIINTQSLHSHRNAYQITDPKDKMYGAVYTPDGKCWAAAYGKSNHCYCIAMDIDDAWFKALTNNELKKYGLIKPMSHEPWHVQLLEHQGMNQKQKDTIRDSILKGKVDDVDMGVKEFQAMAGLKSDGIAGPATKAKALEVLQCCQEILGNDFKTPESVIKACMSSPGVWIKKLNEVPHLGDYTMNILKLMGGKK